MSRQDAWGPLPSPRLAFREGPRLWTLILHPGLMSGCLGAWNPADLTSGLSHLRGTSGGNKCLEPMAAAERCQLGTGWARRRIAGPRGPSESLSHFPVSSSANKAMECHQNCRTVPRHGGFCLNISIQPPMSGATCPASPPLLCHFRCAFRSR